MLHTVSKGLFMRNRAKCKLCETVIESIYRNDYVTCKCGEIAIDGGNQNLHCIANNWENFLRVDDNGNVIIPIIKLQEDNEEKKLQEHIENKEQKQLIPDTSKPSRKDCLDMLDEMIKSYESLPKVAMMTPISHYDFVSLMLLVSSIFRAED